MINSAGPEAQQFWQNAAKSARSPKERIKLFSNLFAIALEADCWEDVRWALLQYRKDDLTLKKAVFFDLILAFQLSYEKQSQTGEPLPTAKLQKDLAYRNVLQVLKNSSAALDKEEKITESRDIRFLAQVLRRQNRGKELLQILDETSAIKHILDSNAPEFLQLRLDVLEEEGMWRELWTLCSSLLGQGIGESQESPPKHSMPLLQNWKVYTRLLSASSRLRDEEEVREKTLELCQRFTNLPSQSRETSLLWLSFTATAQKEDLLPACIAYWKRAYELKCCFLDLRPSVEQLSPSDQKRFLAAINPVAKEIRPSSDHIGQV
jgi:N-terminal acetyltransferase B complex non-catalytic subunit